MRTCLVARTSILRVRRGRLPARILPGPALPRRSRDRHEASPSTPARQFDWVLRGIWRFWSRCSPLCRGCPGTGQGCTSVAAVHYCVIWCHLPGLAGTAARVQGATQRVNQAENAVNVLGNGQ